MESFFNEQDVIETGCSLELLTVWKIQMDRIWRFMKAYEKAATINVQVEAIDNEILVSYNGLKYNISIFFLNKRILQLTIKKLGNEDFCFELTPIEKLSEKDLIHMVSACLTYTN